MHESSATDPETLKASLLDPLLRHRYMNDADVMEQSMASLVSDKLRMDELGNLQEFPEGGKRRIDYILHRKDTPVVSKKLSLSLSLFLILSLFTIISEKGRRRKIFYIAKILLL